MTSVDGHLQSYVNARNTDKVLKTLWQNLLHHHGNESKM